MSRLRDGSKAPLAVAGILALPIFFVGLMAFGLKLDKPTRHLTATGKVAFGDPTKGTVGTIYLCAFGAAAGVVVVGVLAGLLRSRLAAVVPAVAGIVVSVLLLMPLSTWSAGHTKRYPQGTDNIPDPTAKKISPQNLVIKGEWEQSAESTAHQVALVAIGLSIGAILLTVALEVRRRRGIESPAVPPPPEIVGAPEITGG